jgi:hypothetical protein
MVFGRDEELRGKPVQQSAAQQDRPEHKDRKQKSFFHGISPYRELFLFYARGGAD